MWAMVVTYGMRWKVKGFFSGFKRILGHLRELDEASGDWERYRSITLNELKTDRDKRNMVLHALLVSIQASIDIANHLVAASPTSRRPETYRESFMILCDEGLVPEDLAAQLSDFAGFRNVLVHLYCRPDMDEVYGVLQDDLLIVNRYRGMVRAMLRGRLLPE